MKNCLKCGKLLPLTEYYKHAKMADGHLNICKVCVKERVKNDHYRKSKDPSWVEKERERSREKYHRLGYKSMQKEQEAKYPWKKEQVYKNLNRFYKTPKGIEAHHWSYANENLKDVFFLTRKEHKRAHTLLVLNIEKRLFYGLNNELLDTKEKHENYLKSKGINF
jgi:hypothetical protein